MIVLNWLRAALRFLWRLLRVLWVCRVPAASALGGATLLFEVEQARDLFADTGLAPWQWVVFFILLLVWAFLVHSMARRALQHDEWVPQAHRDTGLSEADRTTLRARYWTYAVFWPRALGAYVFVATVIAIYSTAVNLKDSAGLPQSETAIGQLNWLYFGTGAVAAIYLLIVPFERRLRRRLSGRAQIEAPLLDRADSILLLGLYPSAAHRAKLKAIFSARLNQALLGAAGFVTLIFIAAILAPSFVSGIFPRAMFLPILLGGGLLLFGEIASLSHRFATPLLLVFFLSGALLTMSLTHYNDVRWLSKTTSPGDTPHQITIDQAIRSWRAANDCPQQDGCSTRPVIVAGAGGASRAGFMTATVVGALIDEGSRDRAIGDFRKRLFAISSVSGSSVGATMMRAAWMDAQSRKDIGRPPCADNPNAAWFGASEKDKNALDRWRWRNCFQQLMAGDFLSSVFVGLSYRDIFPIGNVFLSRLGDRSALLENAFESWYRTITAPTHDACDGPQANGMCQRLGHLPATPQDGKGDWTPLLFVNGTSVMTGRRIMVSDVRVGCRDASKNEFLDFAYDYRELRDPAARGCGDLRNPTAEPDGIDMRLSTVAMMSARFPLISTQGVLLDTAGQSIDSVVDGGYFENDGLATAADIVQKLQDSGLKPIVIRVANEPRTDVDNSLGEPVPDLSRTTRPPLPKSERSLLDSYTSIGRALIATRSGHEDGHLAYLQEKLNREKRVGYLVDIGVDRISHGSGPLCRTGVDDAKMKIVSMSWWSSQPVQAYLDAQLCAPQAARMLCILRLRDNETADACPMPATN